MSTYDGVCLSVVDVSYTRPMRSGAADDNEEGTVSMFKYSRHAAFRFVVIDVDEL